MLVAHCTALEAHGPIAIRNAELPVLQHSYWPSRGKHQQQWSEDYRVQHQPLSQTASNPMVDREHR